MDESKASPDESTVQHTASDGPVPAIDIEKLAERVYQLMRAEVRLTQARGNKRSTRK